MTKRMMMNDLYKGSSIYALIDHGQIVYIGITDNIHSRIGQHVKEQKKAFNGFEFFHVPSVKRDDLLIIEADLIKTFQPKYNIQQNDTFAGRYHGSLEQCLNKMLRIIHKRRGELNNAKRGQIKAIAQRWRHEQRAG